MIFDNLLLSAVLWEMSPRIRGGTVQKIKQTAKDDIYIDIHCLGNTETLFFSLNPKFPRFYLSQTKAKALPKAPDFCMIMRKYLEGAYLRDIEQEGFDRIIRFTFQNLEGEIFILICEIMGKHSNLILTDSDSRILGCIKSVGPTMSSVRQILIGKNYVLPPNAERINPMECSFKVYESVAHSLRGETKEDRIKEIINSFTGISPYLANELFFETDPKDGEGGFAELEKLRETVKEGRFIANLITDPKGKACNVYPIFLRSVPGEHQLTKTDINGLCDTTCRSIISEENFRTAKAGLLSQINNSLTYRKKSVKDCNTAIDKGQDQKNLQIGELLKASMHSFSKGDRKVTLTDYYDPEMPLIEVSIDEKLTPAENTEKYFRKHRKQKEAARLAEERLEVLISSIEILEAEKEKVTAETSLNAIREIGEKLKLAGLLKTEKIQKEEDRKAFGGFRITRTISPEGWEILYGESATANDHLTTKLARPNDIWLHARQITGAHVIIRTTAKTCNNVPDSTVLFAAKIAAKNSDAKHSGMVPVDRTFKKYVRKPRGSAPGFVLYSNEKTIDVVMK
ncbi:MAG: NFACT family protein [Armatimonadetes bacterium]|nr:NFACT family protein [Candidatus Hippobium faecium]